MVEVEVKMVVFGDGVAVIKVSNTTVIKPVATSIFTKLKEKIEEALSRDDVKAIVLMVKNDDFYGEFDIINFLQAQKTGDLSLLPDVSFGLVRNTIEDAKKPIVAGIEGSLRGVGLEVSMGCHARIASPKTRLGLPELLHGIIPGAGGTQRLPRLVGLQKAIVMMLTSKSISSEEAENLGLIDAIASPHELQEVSKKWALDIAEEHKPWVRSLTRTDKIGSQSESQQIIKVAREQVKQDMPHHQACLEVIEEGIVHGAYLGVLKEDKVFKELVVTETAKERFRECFSPLAASKTRSRI